jgi:MFS family permease
MGLQRIFLAPAPRKVANILDERDMLWLLFAIGMGGDYMIISLMTAEIFGVPVLGRLMGVILTADGIAEVTSPWLMGRLRDTTGSYSEGYVVLISIALLGAATVLALPKARNAT